MTLCLQGGNEFSVGCQEMDGALVDRAPGRVVVTALAGSPGRDYDTATANGVAHFRTVGASDVVGAPDVRSDPAGALAMLRSARLLVLPGGSPLRLLRALTGTPVAALIRELLADDVLVMGSSAGAMVLCSFTVLPDVRAASGPGVEPGLAVAPGVAVLPHWTAGGRGDWQRGLSEADPGLQLLGVPEESGVVLENGVLTAVGRTATRLLGQDRDLAPGQRWQLP